MTKPLSILYIANMRMPTERAHGAQVIKTCEALGQAGATVTLLVPARYTSILEDSFTYYDVSHSFSIVRVPVLDVLTLGKIGFFLESVSFGFFAALYSLIKRSDVLYSRDEAPLWLASFFHNHVVWESHTGRVNFFTKRLTVASKKMVVISKGLKNLYTSAGIQAPILVAHDGIDLKHFGNQLSTERAKERLDLPLDKKILMYIGSLGGWKGVSTLLEASTLLPPEFLVTIIGGNTKEIEELKIHYPNVRFLGEHPYKELPKNEAAADVLILPNTAKDIISAQYTSPLKLFSYMAAKKPILASDLPSIREILDESNAAFFIPDDSNSLAKEAQILFDNPTARGHIAEKALVHVARYTWRARAEAILQFIQT